MLLLSCWALSRFPSLTATMPLRDASVSMLHIYIMYPRSCGASVASQPSQTVAQRSAALLHFDHRTSLGASHPEAKVGMLRRPRQCVFRLACTIYFHPGFAKQTALCVNDLGSG